MYVILYTYIGEGVLFAAVPIISARWNGASEVDFPGVRKVCVISICWYVSVYGRLYACTSMYVAPQ